MIKIQILNFCVVGMSDREDDEQLGVWNSILKRQAYANCFVFVCKHSVFFPLSVKQSRRSEFGSPEIA